MRISVIGAGSWGTTLAILLSRKHPHITLWVWEKDLLQIMEQKHQNTRYLPGVNIPSNVQLTGDLQEAVQAAQVLVMAVPSHVMRTVAEQMVAFIGHDRYIVNVAKGIENDTLLRMSENLHQVLQMPSGQIATLSGPSHAEEVSRNIPTAVVVASSNLETARKIREVFRTENFRVYSSGDIVGVELGGCLKNVIAIAAGICDGAGFGDNTKAALITRGLVEMSRLGVMLGAQKETFAGLSGMGDLVVTCMSRHSRNRHVGEQIGRGKTLQQVLDEMVMVAEGVKTTRSVYQLAQRLGVEMPISEQVYEVLVNNKNPHEAVAQLMTREPKEERLE